MKLVAKDYDETSGITTEYFARTDGKVTVRRWQDAEPIIISNTRQLNSRSSKGKLNTGGEGLGTRVASIPMGFVEEHLAQTGVNIMTCTEAQLKRILNDPEHKRLRTAPGRL